MQPTFNVYDADQKIRRLSAKIGKRNSIVGTTGAIRFALAYTDAAQRAEPAPLDYTTCTDKELATLAVHGITWQIRSAALDTLMQRHQCETMTT